MSLVQIYESINSETEYSRSSSMDDSISLYLDDSESEEEKPEIAQLKYVHRPIENFYEDVAISYSNLSAGRSLALFLWFAGRDTISIRSLANRFRLPVTAVNQILKAVTAFLSSKSKQVIVWPSVTKMSETEQFYHNHMNMPGVIGSVGVTHVLIDPPPKSINDYTDWAGQTSIAVLGICDEDCRFMDMLTGFPLRSGSVHRMYICQNSFLLEKLEATCPPNYYLVGDTTFPCLRTLLTPYKDEEHLSDVQKQFNTNLESARIDIDRAFRMLKLRFQQLNYVSLRGIKLISHFIKACIVLHNMSNNNDLQYLIEHVETEENFRQYVKFNDEKEVDTQLRDIIAEKIYNNNNQRMY